MDVKNFLECFESLPTFRGITQKSTKYQWWDSQGSNFGIKALGFRGNPNNETDELGLNKGGLSRRKTPNGYKRENNSKKRGLKALPKRLKRQTIRGLLSEV